MRKRFEGALEFFELERRIAPSAIFGPLVEATAAFDVHDVDAGPGASVEAHAPGDLDSTLDDLAVADLMADHGGLDWADGPDSVDHGPVMTWSRPTGGMGNEALEASVDEAEADLPLPAMTEAEAQAEIAAAPPAPERGPDGA